MPRVHSFSVLCFPTGETHITSDMCLGEHIMGKLRWPTRDMLQTKKTRCKQKRNAANKKEMLQTKEKRCKQKRHAANKKETLQTKKKCCKQKRNAANKKETLQTKKKRCKQTRNAANKNEHIMRAHTVPEGLGRVLPT